MAGPPNLGPRNQSGYLSSHKGAVAGMFTRPGQKDSKGKKIDAALQPGGDPGDQERPKNFNKQMAQRK